MTTSKEVIGVLKDVRRGRELTAFLDSPVNYSIGEYLSENDRAIGISALARGVQAIMGSVRGTSEDDFFDSLASEPDLTSTTFRSVLDASSDLQTKGLISVIENKDFSLTLRGKLLFELSKRLLELETPVAQPS